MNLDLIHRRQRDILDHRLLAELPVTMIGLGATGSFTATVLSRMGFQKFCLYDPDVVGEENLGTQLYGVENIGQPKVHACRDNLLRSLPHLEIYAHAERYIDQPLLDGVLVVGVDSMNDRRLIWESVQAQSAESLSVRLLVDARTAGRELHFHTVRSHRPDEAKRYSESIVPDDQATNMPCTASGASYISSLVAGLIGNQIVLWCRDEPYKEFFVVFLRDLLVS